jgi:hypothetical protein
MKVYVVVKESSSDSTVTGSVVLGVFADENSAIECVNTAHEKYVHAKLKDSSLRETCYITDTFLHVKDDNIINLANSACPKPDEYFHQTDETIFCEGFISGYVHATAKDIK